MRFSLSLSIFSIVTLAVIAEHMPDGGEATAAALLAAISNFSGIFAASLIGAQVVESLGIKNGEYGNLPYAIIIRSVVILVPVVFIPFLVPSGCSADRVRYNLDELDGKANSKGQEGGGGATDAAAGNGKETELSSELQPDMMNMEEIPLS